MNPQFEVMPSRGLSYGKRITKNRLLFYKVDEKKIAAICAKHGAEAFFIHSTFCVVSTDEIPMDFPGTMDGMHSNPVSREVDLCVAIRFPDDAYATYRRAQKKADDLYKELSKMHVFTPEENDRYNELAKQYNAMRDEQFGTYGDVHKRLAECIHELDMETNIYFEVSDGFGTEPAHYSIFRGFDDWDHIISRWSPLIHNVEDVMPKGAYFTFETRYFKPMKTGVDLG